MNPPRAQSIITLHPFGKMQMQASGLAQGVVVRAPRVPPDEKHPFDGRAYIIKGGPLRRSMLIYVDTPGNYIYYTLHLSGTRAPVNG